MKKIFLLSLVLIYSTLSATYIQRFSTTDNGGITFTGNTLGLSKATGQNNPGTLDAIGAFITTNTPLPSPVGNYPNDGLQAGTTLDYTKNSSSAYLDLPDGSEVLYAELIWSGSYDYYSQITGNEPDGPILLITPQLNSYQITADPATRQNATTPSYGCPGPTPTPCKCPCGNYVRSNNVTSIVQKAGAGLYTVGKVAATIAAGDDTHNSAGWTLAVAYRHPEMYTYNMTLFVGCEQASYSQNQPAIVSGFYTPTSGPLTGRLFISAIEGDANKTGDTMLFSSTLPFTPSDRLTGDNNPTTNFFASQINTLLPLHRDVLTGKLIAQGSSQQDTRGSYGTYNSSARGGYNVSGGRQGYDITSIDISPHLSYNQTSAYALGTTTADDYTINAVAMQIQIGAPIITGEELVNELTSVNSVLGEVVTFSITLTNTGTLDAESLVIFNTLEEGLLYLPGSFTVNNESTSDPNLDSGYDLGQLKIGETVTITFQATIVGYPVDGLVFTNNTFATYSFEQGTGQKTSLSTNTNSVAITLPKLVQPPHFPSPTNFTGCVKRCCNIAVLTWDPPTAPPFINAYPAVVNYRIYSGNQFLKKVAADAPRREVFRFRSMDQLRSLCIKACYANGEESPPCHITF